MERYYLFSPNDGRSMPYDPAAARSEEDERELGRFCMGVKHLPATDDHCSIGGDNIVYCHFILQDKFKKTKWWQSGRLVWGWKLGAILEIRMPWVKFDRQMPEWQDYRIRNVCWDDYTKELFSDTLDDIDRLIGNYEAGYKNRTIQEMPPPHFFNDAYQLLSPARLPGWIEHRNSDLDNLVLGVKPRFRWRRR